MTEQACAVIEWWPCSAITSKLLSILSIKTAHALNALVVFFVSTLSAMSAERIVLTNKESINAVSLQCCMQHDLVKTTPC